VYSFRHDDVRINYTSANEAICALLDYPLAGPGDEIFNIVWDGLFVMRISGIGADRDDNDVISVETDNDPQGRILCGRAEVLLREKGIKFSIDGEALWQAELSS